MLRFAPLLFAALDRVPFARAAAAPLDAFFAPVLFPRAAVFARDIVFPRAAVFPFAGLFFALLLPRAAVVRAEVRFGVVLVFAADFVFRPAVLFVFLDGINLL